MSEFEFRRSGRSTGRGVPWWPVVGVVLAMVVMLLPAACGSDSRTGSPGLGSGGTGGGGAQGGAGGQAGTGGQGGGPECQVNSDCDSSVCEGGHCLPAACDDGVKNGDETDVDCGGGCTPCDDGGGCAVGADCASGVCTAGVCQAPTCADGVANGGESDVDCGAVCGPPDLCAVGELCAAAADCASGVCTAGVCQPLDFGGWDSGFTFNTDYQASSSGFVVVRAHMPSGPTRYCSLRGYTDGSSSPTTNRVSAAVVDNTTGETEVQYGGLTMPVRAGDSWRVETSGSNCTDLDLFWLPVGTGATIFGDWDETVGFDSVYQATTDGLVVVNAVMPSGPNRSCAARGYTDGTAIPTIERIATTVVDNTTGETEVQMGGFVMPVRQGDSWKVALSGNVCSNMSIAWLPFEHLGAWDGGKALDTVYQASTAGFVVLGASIGSGSSLTCALQGFTDGADPPVTGRVSATVVDNATGEAEVHRSGLFMPVRGGDRWRVTTTGNACGAVSLFWLPFGG